MGIGPIASLAGSYISSLLSGSSNNTASSATTSTAVKADSSPVSPFAQILGSLQQLQQSNPAQYSQVTNKIATNLQHAANAATSSGNTSLASQFTQLSKDFGSASSSGHLPNVLDLTRSIGVANHGHHQAANDPAAIIYGTLTNAGISTAAL